MVDPKKVSEQRKVMDRIKWYSSITDRRLPLFASCVGNRPEAARLQLYHAGEVQDFSVVLDFKVPDRIYRAPCWLSATPAAT
jgi:hypothetical protein